MTYMSLLMDMSNLTAEDAASLIDEGAELGIDIDDFSPEMSPDPSLAIVVSGALGAIAANLSNGRFRVPGATMWKLLRRVLESYDEASAVRDSSTRVTFIVTPEAKRQGLSASDALIEVCRALNRIPDGSVLHWNGSSAQWQFTDPAQSDANFLVLTATALEYEACRRHLVNPTDHYLRADTRLEKAALPGGAWHVYLGMTGQGGIAAATITERAITVRPAALLFVGVAGALREDLELGDVVVATHVYAYQGGLEEDSGLSSRPKGWETSFPLREIARRVAASGDWCDDLPPREKDPRVVFAPVAAGDVVLNSKRSYWAQLIQTRYSDAAAIEMESAGVAQASHLNNSLPLLPIRGISDLADGRKYLHDGKGTQQTAAENAAAFAFALIGALSGDLWAGGRTT